MGRAVVKALRGRAHRIYRLAPDLLLVFKPSGHREDEHEHARAQRLRVLRGMLTVRVGGKARVLTGGRRTLTIPARRAHRTEATGDTWLVVEWLDDRPAGVR
jgi:quercetin dioxygenase-like cupin family protein